MRTVRFDQQGRPTGSKTAEVQKNLILHITQLYQTCKTGMPEEAKKAEADKKRRKNLCSGKYHK